MSPAQLALAWCDSRWYVGSTIIGATSVAQLEENAGAWSVNLDEETLSEIDAIHQQCKSPCLVN